MSNLTKNKKVFAALIITVIAALIGIICGSVAVSASFTGNGHTVSISKVLADADTSKFSDVDKAIYLIGSIGYLGGIAVLVITFVGLIFLGIMIGLMIGGKINSDGSLAIVVLILSIMFLLFTLIFGSISASFANNFMDPEWRNTFYQNYKK